MLQADYVRNLFASFKQVVHEADHNRFVSHTRVVYTCDIYQKLYVNMFVERLQYTYRVTSPRFRVTTIRRALIFKLPKKGT